MRERILAATAAALLVAALASCAQTSSAAPVDASTPTPVSPPATPTAPASAEQSAPTEVVGTVVRFTSDRTSVDVTIGEDNPAVRDFLAMLPLELTVEEFAGAEKIAYLPRELSYEGSPGSDPEDGDLIYYTSWGNLGFYYDATGIGYSDATLHLGTYSATEEQLSLLEGSPVTIAIVD
ncbi:cyclophilin-like fold protein [Microbacterium sp. NPDC079176]|uniref:cyclophilin-like fold protein n=1 Tax=Microbacterium sp. NPDC079176 TaxID=3154768 RepID=UPI0034359D62